MVSPSFISVPIERCFADGTCEATHDVVLCEYILSLRLGSRLLVKLICTPRMLRELVIGYLYSEALIDSLDQIESLDIDETTGEAKITLSQSAAQGASQITTESGDFLEVPWRFAARKMKPVKPLQWHSSVILAHARELLSRSETFKKTGNVHSVMIARDNDVLCFAEDVGRYNAFDKCIGTALLQGENLQDCAVFTSGRIPSSIALKTLHCGIPIIVSRSAPTDTTLALARQYNLTVIGFARGERMNHYITD